MKISIIILAVLICSVLFFSCKMNTNRIFYNVEVTHPSDELRVEFVKDTIFTVGGGKAHLPFGGTNRNWGFSNVFFNEQSGVPKRVKIIFYALYEDRFYELDVELPVDRMERLMDRVYAMRESESSEDERIHSIV